MKGLHRLLVGYCDVLGAPAVFQPGVLGSDAGIVEPGRDRVGLDDLAVLVLQQVGAVAVEHAGLARAQGRCVLAALQPVTRRFHPDQAHLLVRDVRVEDAHGIGAAADTGEDGVGLAPGELRHLLSRLAPDHRLEIAHHHRIRMRTGDGADDVEGVLDVGHPVAHRFVERVLQRLRSAFHRHHGSAQQLHAIDVRRLALDVLRAHVDHALHAVARGDSGGRHPVHAGAGFGDDARLAHAAREQRLADHVVDLVRAGVVEVFALEIDLRAAEALRPAPGVVDRARSPDVVLELVGKLGEEIGILLIARVGFLELVERMDQRLGDEHSAVRPIMAAGIGQVIHPHCALP